MTNDDVIQIIRERANELRILANRMPNTAGGKERLKAAEELGRCANRIEELRQLEDRSSGVTTSDVNETDVLRGYHSAIDAAATACDQRGRIGITGKQSHVVVECRARVLAAKSAGLTEAFDRAVHASFMSGAASAAYDVRRLHNAAGELARLAPENERKKSG